MRKLVMLAALVLVLSPASARADWLFTPHVGSTFGEGGFTYGASIGWMGAGKFGWETEFAWTPGFLDLDATDDEFDEFDEFGSSFSTTVPCSLSLPAGADELFASGLFSGAAVTGAGVTGAGLVVVCGGAGSLAGKKRK